MSDELEHRTSLVDELLAEQSRLDTAVCRFSEWHDENEEAHAQARLYHGLIPLSKPLRGEQYAFEVNLDQCTGCKACVAACHSLNGLDDDESWRDVGMLVGDVYIPYQQTVTTACHHCLDPACSNGCPVLAYEKDAVTGIVRHLDDQCIGCSYCILKCPYDVPKYNKKRGIVRKCDMCHQRLDVGEAPACVQSCPNGAIAIRIVNVAEVSASTRQPGTRLLPTAMVSDYTQPSTRYLSKREVPASATGLKSASPAAEDTHLPLVIMLVLTQLATGAILFAQNTFMLWIGAVTAVIGINASVLHLGQPLKAWRCFLGWRKSWLSREILAFGGFAPAAIGAALHLLPATVAAAVGIASVFCSVMVYVDTKRSYWTMSQTLPKFFGTTLSLGLALAACWDHQFIFPTVVTVVVKLLWEAGFRVREGLQAEQTHRLLFGSLNQLWTTRVVVGVLGATLMTVSAITGFTLLLIAELLERALFFKAGAAWRMPR
ncbi:dimethyl sulfoxide reductase anchor subunit [soil metagenome]